MLGIATENLGYIGCASLIEQLNTYYIRFPVLEKLLAWRSDHKTVDDHMKEKKLLSNMIQHRYTKKKKSTLFIHQI